MVNDKRTGNSVKYITEVILILGRFASAKMLRMSYTERNSLI
jgi:hypothetical protein